MHYNRDRIDAAAEDILAASRTPGLALAVSHHGAEDYTRGFGYSDITQRHSVHGNTGFRIGSVTKTFTVSALAMLREEGRLQWDDSIGHHLPYFEEEDPLFSGKLKLRDALSHQAGFGWHDPLWYNSPWDRSAVLQRARRVLAHATRRQFHYSNLGFILAGEVLACAAGGSYEEFVFHRLLNPLGMESSGFGLRPDMATGYEILCSGHLAAVGAVDVQKANPACGLISCAKDLALWLRFMLGSGVAQDRQLLKIESVWQLFEPQVKIRPQDDSRFFSYFPCADRLQYGLGWFRSSHLKRTVISHTGSLPGYRAHLALIPEEQLGIAVLANLSHTWAPDALVYTIVDQLLGIGGTDWVEHYRRSYRRPGLTDQSHSSHYEALRPDPGLYCGSYTNRAYGDVTVARDSETLTFEWTNYRSRMRATGADQFWLEDLNCPLLADNREVKFRRLGTGEVEGLEFVETRFQRLN